MKKMLFILVFILCTTSQVYAFEVKVFRHVFIMNMGMCVWEDKCYNDIMSGYGTGLASNSENRADVLYDAFSGEALYSYYQEKCPNSPEKEWRVDIVWDLERGLGSHKKSYFFNRFSEVYWFVWTISYVLRGPSF